MQSLPKMYAIFGGNIYGAEAAIINHSQNLPTFQ